MAAILPNPVAAAPAPAPACAAWPPPTVRAQAAELQRAGQNRGLNHLADFQPRTSFDSPFRYSAASFVFRPRQSAGPSNRTTTEQPCGTRYGRSRRNIAVAAWHARSADALKKPTYAEIRRIASSAPPRLKTACTRAAGTEGQKLRAAPPIAAPLRSVSMAPRKPGPRESAGPANRQICFALIRTNHWRTRCSGYSGPSA